MSTYGRNFEFRQPPRGAERDGRYSIDAASDPLPIGAPVVTNGDRDDLGRACVVLASADAPKPAPGKGGVMVFEYAPSAYAGDDVLLTTYSDKGTVAAGKAVQVISGETVKVVLRNTADQTFLHVRDYEGFNLVAPAAVGLTPVEDGDYLGVGAGDGTDGYWKKVTDAADAWLVVTKVDTNRGEIEARLNF